ncbi:MAG: FecR domain-containing protein [Acidobacteriota bacterium]|nr:FecR domain-containing protein [Acidobacteriota bacterium]
MVRTIDRFVRLSLAATVISLFSGHVFAQEDPPSRVARLNYISGNVSMEPAGIDDWAPADLNRPFTIGDYLFADQGAQAELHLDTAVIRMGPVTSFGFLNLDDRAVQVKLTEGDMYIRLHNFGSDQVFEVDTPNAAVTLLRDGVYRFRVDANGSMTFVVVRQGSAEITGGGQAFTLNPGNSAMLTGTDQLAYDVEVAPALDEFDQWSQERDAHEAQLASARYIPPTVIGYEDLDDYGNWQNSTDYGAVWYPRNVDQGWAPYHNGHWAWIDPWGWTWVDSMPWGFAPFHYGRWAYIGNRWGWCPGPIAVGYRGPAVRPYYAPALVAWFGGAHFGVGISIDGGPSLGWVPLGRGEIYTPAYRCSPRYFNNVNVSNTRIVNNVNITNIYNNVYVNKQVYNQQYVNVRAPNAVMAMPQAAFASGRSVRQAALPVRQADFVNVQNAAVTAPPVAPTRQSLVAAPAGRPVARPSAQVMQRQVVARNTPPAAPSSFSTRQQYFQQHAGQPANFQAAQQASGARPAATNVRQAPPAQPVAARPGMRVGEPVGAYNRPAAGTVGGNVRPSPQLSTQPVRSAQPARQQVGVSRPVEQTQPSVPAHGAPPNVRQQQSSPQVPQNGRFAERTPPQNQAAPTSRAVEQPRTEERTQPAVERAPAPSRQQPQIQERTQPTPERNAYPERRPGNEERSQPANRSGEHSAPPAEHAEHAAPPAQHSEHGAPPASHEDHPKDDHPKDDHPKKDK